MIDCRFLSEDCYARLKIGGLDVCDETPFEPGAQAVFERLDLTRMPVARQDDMLVRIVKCIERMEEFFLRVFLCPMACMRCVLPSPTPPYMKKGL